MKLNRAPVIAGALLSLLNSWRCHFIGDMTGYHVWGAVFIVLAIFALAISNDNGV